MKVSTVNYSGKISDVRLSGCTVIVIDVLRSSTCIIWALRNGATKVIPAVDPGDAASMHMVIGGDSVLAGERGGVKITGFDIGNSPMDFTASTVKGKTVIVSTTNGTGAICAASSAPCVLIGGMINKTAVAKKAIELGNDVILLCAGTDGEVSADDICAAGAIAQAIYDNCGNIEYQQKDMTFKARELYKDHCSKRTDLSRTKHGRRLVELGFSADVSFCLTEDMTDTVPEFTSGIIQ